MKPKILFLIPAFTRGGAEQNLLRLLKAVATSTLFDYSVALIKKDVKFRKELPDNIHVYYLSGFGKWNFCMHLAKLIMILLKLRPQIVISYFLYCNFCVFLARYLSNVSAKCVVSIRTPPWSGQKYERLGWFRLCMLGWLYSKTDHFLINSNGMKEELINKFGTSEKLIDVIPNSVDIKHIQMAVKEDISHRFFGRWPIIISSGRLVYLKGFDTLFRAVTLSKGMMPFGVIVLGEGHERRKLENLARSLGINDVVDMVGFQENPYAWIVRADIFVLASRWEGLPNALMDAMACGLAVVACDCPTGPRDLIKNGENGYLVPVDDVDTMASTIKNLLENAPLRERLAQYAKESVQKYSVENIGRQFESLLLKLTSC